ncbi:MAG: glycosyltransferase family 2 protein [Paludibaculum sp.]
MSSPKVSILMGAYNRAHFLEAALTALQAQTFTDWELIVPDDGSRDNTPEVARRLAASEPRMTYLRHDDNQGISINYNRGFARCRGEYVAMIDDDDRWCLDNKLATQLDFLDSHQDYVGCGGGLIIVDPTGQEMYRYLKPETNEAIRAAMLFSNPMANSTTVFRREAGERVGWYDSSIRYSGDRDFWMKMGLLGKLYNFPEYLSYYTMGSQNTSIVHMKPHLKTSLMLTKRYHDKYPGYTRAIAVNYLQYWYAFLPPGVHSAIHTTAARAKRKLFG